MNIAVSILFVAVMVLVANRAAAVPASPSVLETIMNGRVQ